MAVVCHRVLVLHLRVPEVMGRGHVRHGEQRREADPVQRAPADRPQDLPRGGIPFLTSPKVLRRKFV